MKKGKLIAMLLVLVLVVTVFAGCASQKDIDALNAKVAALETEKKALEADKTALQADKTALQADKTELEAAVVAASEYDPNGWVDHMLENPDYWMTPANGAWSEDAKDQPTNEELTKMLDIAMTSHSACGMTPVYCVVLREYEDQFEIIGNFWDTAGDQMVYGTPGASVTEGTVTILFYADKVLPQDQHATEYGKLYIDGEAVRTGYLYMHLPYMAQWDVGLSMGLCQTAAHSLGYNTHIFGGLYGKSVTKVAGADGDLYTADGFLTDEMLQGRGFIRTYGNDVKDIPTVGNMALVGAIVIGQVSEEAKALGIETYATYHARPTNYAFWDDYSK